MKINSNWWVVDKSTYGWWIPGDSRTFCPSISILSPSSSGTSRRGTWTHRRMKNCSKMKLALSKISLAFDIADNVPISTCSRCGAILKNHSRGSLPKCRFYSNCKPIWYPAINLPNFWSTLCTCFLKGRKLPHCAKAALIKWYCQITFSLLHRFGSQLCLRFWRFDISDRRRVFRMLCRFCTNQDSRDGWLHRWDIYCCCLQVKVSIFNCWSMYPGRISMTDWGIIRVISHAGPSSARFILTQLYTYP